MSNDLDPTGLNATVAQVVREDEPEIEVPADTKAVLPSGVKAEVRELTGEDEEILARQLRASTVRFANTVVRRGTVSLNETPVADAMVNALSLGDRDSLLVAIRRVTYGDKVTLEGVVCQACGRSLDVELDLADTVKADQPDVAQRFSVPLRRGRVANVRQPSIEDEEYVDSAKKETVAEQNTLMLSRVVLDIDGNEILSIEDARALSLADRRALIKALADHHIGPSTDEFVYNCTCGMEGPLGIEFPDLFRI